MNGLSPGLARSLARAINKHQDWHPTVRGVKGRVAEARYDRLARDEWYVFVPMGGKVKRPDDQCVTSLSKAAGLGLISETQKRSLKPHAEIRNQAQPGGHA